VVDFSRPNISDLLQRGLDERTNVRPSVNNVKAFNFSFIGQRYPISYHAADVKEVSQDRRSYCRRGPAELSFSGCLLLVLPISVSTVIIT
jgi:hypothetical protein